MKKIAQTSIVLDNIKTDSDEQKNWIADYPAISRIGIWGPPQTTLQFNGGKLVLNEYGIYELDLTDTSIILDSITVPKDQTGILYIDMIYEGKENTK